MLVDGSSHEQVQNLRTTTKTEPEHALDLAAGHGMLHSQPRCKSQVRGPGDNKNVPEAAHGMDPQVHRSKVPFNYIQNAANVTSTTYHQPLLLQGGKEKFEERCRPILL